VDLFVILLSNLCRSTDSTQCDQSPTRDSPIPLSIQNIQVRHPFLIGCRDSPDILCRDPQNDEAEAAARLLQSQAFHTLKIYDGLCALTTQSLKSAMDHERS
jgi:hypothetical protein